VPVKSFDVTATIAAPPDRVWPILTNAAAYPSWNSAVTRIEGTIAPGQSIKVFVPVNPGRTFPVMVSTFEAPRRMVWSGGMPLGLFTGTRTFTLTEQQPGTTEFHMREVYTGLLAGMMSKQIPDLSGAFQDFAQGLKKASESGNPKEGA
jgi:hypothetical protein